MRRNFHITQGQAVKMWKLLNEAAHSVYCGDAKERVRLKLPGCVACRWRRLKKKYLAGFSLSPSRTYKSRGSKTSSIMAPLAVGTARHRTEQVDKKL